MYRTYTQAMETYSRHASMAGWRGGSPTRNGWNHAAVKLETLVCNKTLCKDISKLSGGCQTSSVEGFHSLLIQFAPKMILIAALHYNENANRVQDVTKTGEARFSINYPKGRKGAAVLRRVLESPTYEYAQELLEEIVKECTDKENVDAEFAVEPVIVPPPLCAQFPHPEKADFAAVKLETLVCNKTLCKDISKLSGGCQTSSVEGFHSLLIQFAPKMILIAALHYNENANRVQDVTKTGEARFSINYPKGRKGAAVLRRVLESPTYEYAQELLEEIVKECTDKENVDAEEEAVPRHWQSMRHHSHPKERGITSTILIIIIISISIFTFISRISSTFVTNLSSSEDDYQKNSEPDMDEPVTPIHKENKFIVFMTCLTKLLTWCHCPDCGSFDISNCHNVFGSLLVITLSCASCYKKVTWNSQPYIGSTPAGNILLSILLSGATAGKVLRVMRTMALATISSRTYFGTRELFCCQLSSEIFQKAACGVQ
ncbi:hypothetical protein F7725_000036 [Dissostichus mawsoni]|uniref:Uncharacterized protein n=1 Tax=Dissostichus mawsoni TaxID=36200 RepID=A0A7J5ZHZ2_DISMA|nr:hypothetical protein F7725_000036 [Dissostichus mawsoni]